MHNRMAYIVYTQCSHAYFKQEEQPHTHTYTAKRNKTHIQLTNTLTTSCIV